MYHELLLSILLLLLLLLKYLNRFLFKRRMQTLGFRTPTGSCVVDRVFNDLLHDCTVGRPTWFAHRKASRYADRGRERRQDDRRVLEPCKIRNYRLRGTDAHEGRVCPSSSGFCGPDFDRRIKLKNLNSVNWKICTIRVRKYVRFYRRAILTVLTV